MKCFWILRLICSGLLHFPLLTIALCTWSNSFYTRNILLQMHFKMNQLIRINFNGGQHLSELSWTASDRFSVKEIETFVLNLFIHILRESHFDLFVCSLVLCSGQRFLIISIKQMSPYFSTRYEKITGRSFTTIFGSSIHYQESFRTWCSHMQHKNIRWENRW